MSLSLRLRKNVGHTLRVRRRSKKRTWNGIVTLGDDDIGNDVCFGLALAAGLAALAPLLIVAVFLRFF